jgi:hypothetical protein
MTDKPIDVAEIFEQARRDPELFSTMDIETLLEAVESDKHDYLENKTTQIITDEIFEQINSLNLDIETKEKYCKGLMGYRYVDEIHELHTGKHVRWIHPEKKKLTNGGVVTKIEFLDTGTYIQAYHYGNRFTRYKFDENITFQKMTMEEQLILMAYEYAGR